MKTEMYKRIWSALLVLILVLQCMPLGAVRAELTDPTQETSAAEVPAETGTAAETTEVSETTEASEATEATSAPETEPAAEAVDPCPYCEETVAEDGTVTHALNCTAQYVYDGTADVGKYVRLIPEIAENGVEVSSNHSGEDSLYFYYEEFGADTVMRITDWYWDAGTTGLWYQVELYSGSFPESTEDYTWPDPAWILQDYTDTTYEYDAALEFVTVELPDTGCDICGKEDCTSLHFWCDYCNSYDCGKAHLICRACGDVDCEKQHIFCGYCNGYDCGLSHDHKPAAAPVIPENPTLTDGTDVTVVDGNGDAVTGEFILFEGMKSSLSAWTKLEGDVSYQWQVFADGQWIDIQGQTGKGLLASAAMFRSLDSAVIRCAAASDGQTLTSDGISVVITEQPEQASFALASNMAALAAEDNSGNLRESYVVVQYVYSDGRTAAATDFAEIVTGNAYRHSYTLPIIPGYKATLDTHSYGSSAVLDGDSLVMDFAENVLTDEYIIFTVTYVPDYVSYTVIHYWQNVDNDNYTEHERETIATRYKTGDVIEDVHKSYPGFYNLLYETPAAAADGSTVIEVYYDRYYYLMTFNLGDMGYGVEPIYARYGDSIEIGTPTRAGYTFLGWTLNGEEAAVPGTMPEENREYVAQWKKADSAKVSVVIWGENPDDEGYSYQEKESFIMEAVPGETISWDTLRYNCGYTAHTHSVANGCYELVCDIDSHDHTNCGLICGLAIHTHSAACCTKASEIHTIGTSCYGDDIGNAFSGSIGEWRVQGTESNGSIGQSYTLGGTGRKYIYVNGTWYRYNGSVAIGGTASTVCNGIHSHNDHTCTYCDLTEHASHSDECYDCGQKATDHQHNIGGCYTLICTQTEHTHVSGCEVDKEVMDTDLWTFVRSNTVTVEADGSTVLNVYFDRTTFTLTFHYSYSNSTYRKTSTITDKWGADIGERFLAVNTAASGNLWSTSTSGDSPWTSYLQIMPQNNMDYYCKNSSTNEQTAEYYTQNLDGTYSLKYAVTAYYGSNLSISKEDFYEMEGFIYSHGTDGKGTAMPSPGSYGNFDGAKFYYDRRSYSLVFNDGYTDVKTESVKFEAPLSTYEDYEPTLPSAYEAGSREFAGWYLNPECTGAEYDLSRQTMRSEDIKLYAKWEPVTYTVNYYLTRDSLTRGENIPTEMARLVEKAIADGEITKAPETDPYTTVFGEKTVQHGAYIGAPGDPEVAEGYDTIHPRAGYDFVGWFYLNDDGEETAFDPVNMPVHQDLDLYAKWSSNVLCQYNVYFALDANADGVADVDTNGSIIYVADPISGSAIAGRTYTFTAKGGEDLYDPDGDVNYRQGYFPTVGSHSIVIDIQDEAGTGANSYTFLYRPRAEVPYTVKYLEAGTDKVLHEQKYVADNKNVVVTENFVYIAGYMPDAYQKTLVVTDDNDTSNDVIIFYYAEDTEHALYVVNYYIQDLNDDLSHKGWSRYTSLQNQGDINTEYSADAIAIDGFTLSQSDTDDYNVTQKKNGMDDTDLPAEVGALTGEKLTGTLTAKGLELNFYYTRNIYPYEFRYMLNGTTIKLAETEVGKAGYDTVVSMGAKEIEMDLDGDGVNEDYRLYDPTETSKDIHIIKDGDPLTAGTAVSEGQATVNVATFYYVRCTQTMTITKEVVDNSTADDPDPNREYTIRLLIHATSGYHRNSYTYTKTGDESGTLEPVPSAPNTLQFTLKAGETITIEGLPTAEYTVSELDLPLGYYDTYTPDQKNKLTVDDQLDVTVTNTYAPADLVISKTVVEKETGNLPEVAEFLFKVVYTGDETLAGSYTYSVSGMKDGVTTTETRTAAVEGNQFNFALEKGETAYFHNLPTGTYTVEEEDYAARGYKTSYTLDPAKDPTSGRTADVTLEAGQVTQVHFTNEFPVGDLKIQKTVTKEAYGTEWDGDTFRFTVIRANEGKPLVTGKTYNLYLGDQNDLDEQPAGTATVDGKGQLVVSITFGSEDAETLKTAGASAVHTLRIENLPAGTYVVTEEEDAEYTQTPLSVEALEIPNSPVAVFTNHRKVTITYHSNYPAGSGLDDDVVSDAEAPNGTYQIKTCKDTGFAVTEYTFDGWNTAANGTGTNYEEGQVYNGSENLTLYAKWKINTYTVTFVNDNGDVLSTTEYAYGTKAADVVKPADPTKKATAQYTYTFAGWTPKIVDVTQDATYTATYDATVNQYTVTFVDEDGTTVLWPATKYDYGTAAAEIVKPADPTKAATAQYTYTFAGWDPEVSAVTGDVTYKAWYEEHLRTYTITFQNEDGTLLESKSWEYGATPSYDGIPTKDPSDEVTYTFNGWSPAVAPVTGDATYTATYLPATRTYEVIWKNDNGDILETDTAVEYGTMPEYNGDGPTKEGTAEYSYTFAGWSPAVTKVTGNAVYTATYTETKNTYTVIWKDDDGTVLETDENVPYGAWPTYNSAEPTKAADAQYTYEFQGWTPEISMVTGDVTYTAAYTETVKKYTVLWLDEDGTLLEMDEQVPYGTTPTYEGEPPVKAPDAQFTYTFSGWTPEVSPVTGDVTYTAAYTAAGKTYTVYWVNDDGTVLEKDENVVRGTMPEYNGSTPTKAEDAQYVYTFSEWSPTVSKVTGDVVYTARYTGALKNYTVTWVHEDGTLLETDENVPYGTMPEYNGVIPAKPGADGKTYSFDGWSPLVSPVTGNITYTAQFTEDAESYTITYVSNYPLDLEPKKAVETKQHGVNHPIKNAGTLGFVADGYTCIGWNTAANGSGIDYAADTEFTGNKDLTLYAQWVDSRLDGTHDVFIGINVPYHQPAGTYEYPELDHLTVSSYHVFPEEPLEIYFASLRAYFNTTEGKWYTNTNYDNPISTEPWKVIDPALFKDENYKTNYLGTGSQGLRDPDVYENINTDGSTIRKYFSLSEEAYKGIIGAWLSSRANNASGTDIPWDKNLTVEDFKAVPYVIKYHGGHWYVDMIILAKNKYILTYIPNMADGYSGAKGIPAQWYGENYEVTLEHPGTITKTEDGLTYTGTFQYWQGDDGKIYNAGEEITMVKNLTLTAKWKYEVAYRVEHYKKDPITGIYVRQDEDTLKATAILGETITVTPNSYDGYYVVGITPESKVLKYHNQEFAVYYDPIVKLTISQEGLGADESAIYHVYGNGVDMLVEIQGGQSVTLEHIPVGSYTVTELTGWTWKYDSDAERNTTNSSKTILVTEAGPNNLHFDFDSTDPDWLGGEGHENNEFLPK